MTDLLSADPVGPIVMLATPAYGAIQPLHELAVIDTMRDLAKRGYRTLRKHSVGNPLLHDSRANLLGDFWRSGADWMCMVDGDIGFPGAMLGDMVRWANVQEAADISQFGLEKIMLAAVAPMRDYAIDKVLATGDPMDGVSFAMTPHTDAIDSDRIIEGFIERQCVGTGFVLAHRTAVGRMIKANPEQRFVVDGLETWGLFHPFIHKDKSVPEDVAFFDRWRLLGGRIWVKLDAPMTHTGPMTVGANLRDVLLGGKSPVVTASDAKVMAWREGKL